MYVKTRTLSLVRSLPTDKYKVLIRNHQTVVVFPFLMSLTSMGNDQEILSLCTVDLLHIRKSSYLYILNSAAHDNLDQFIYS